MYVRAAACALLSLALLATPGRAPADVAKCESKLLSNAAKFGSNLSKSLQKCSAVGRAAVAKFGAVDGVAADACEKNLAKIFNIGGLPGKGLVNKTRKSLDKLFVAGAEVCTGDDLARLGVLESGVNAPGTNPHDFVVSWLLLRETQRALDQVFAVSGDLQGLLDDMADLSDCDGAVLRPNLCTFTREQNPDCVVKTCNMSSSAKLQLPLTGGTTASLQDRPLTMQVCRAPATLLDLPLDFSDSFRLLDVGAATRLGPTSLLGTNATVCIDQIRGSGWCDCSGAAVPFEPTTCSDHIANDNAGTCSVTGGFCLVDDDCPDRDDVCSAAPIDDCGASLADAAIEDTCVRGGTAGDDCQDGTGRCIDRTTYGPCHSGTYRGAAVTGFAGASTAGSCMLQQTVSLRVLPAAICANGLGNPLGACTTVCAGPGPCAADATCTGIGGTQCLPSTGADGIACTRDDPGLPLPATTVALTTGTATVTNAGRLLQGTCSGASVNAGMNCATDQDCNGGTCGGEVILAPQSTSVSGAGLTCPQLDGGQLGTLRLVGGFAWFDGAAGIGDNLATLTLDCD